MGTPHCSTPPHLMSMGTLPPVPEPVTVFGGSPGKREHIVKVQLHTGGPGPTVSFTKGGFYYGDKRDTAWNNEMNYREMLTKEAKQQLKDQKENERKERERQERERYDRMVQSMTRHR